MDETGGEYEDAHFIGMEIIWGKGFMSPGGAAEVASVVDGVVVKGKRREHTVGIIERRVRHVAVSIRYLKIGVGSACQVR